MNIHHLNCGTMHPPGATLVCHVLLIESKNGLVLVDAGLGLRDAVEPGRRFGPARFFVRPAFDQSESAIRQIERLGLNPRDVRHIVLTHFDADHTGGLADFPWADVHLTAAEAFAAMHPKTATEKGRYLPAQWEHRPKLVEHTPDGERWKDFAAAKPLTQIDDGIVLVSLPGHTRGHAAIAVDSGSGWILHAGDAFYHHGQIDGTGKSPPSLTGMERMVAHDWMRVRENHRRLSELYASREQGLSIVCAHDPTMLARLQNAHEGTERVPDHSVTTG